MKRKTITKEYLESLGVVNVSREGKVFTANGEKKESVVKGKHKYGKDKSYPIITLYDRKLFEYQKRNCKQKSGMRLLLLSRVVYAWFNDVCPEELDVDHIDNNPFNNSIDNLQLLTRQENLIKRGYGRNQYNAHLTDEQIREIKLLKSKKSYLIRCIKELKDDNLNLRMSLKKALEDNDLTTARSIKGLIHKNDTLIKDLRKDKFSINLELKASQNV